MTFLFQRTDLCCERSWECGRMSLNFDPKYPLWSRNTTERTNLTSDIDRERTSVGTNLADTGLYYYKTCIHAARFHKVGDIPSENSIRNRPFFKAEVTTRATHKDGSHDDPGTSDTDNTPVTPLGTCTQQSDFHLFSSRWRKSNFRCLFATTWPVVAVYVSKWVLTVLIHNVKSTFKFIHYLVSQWVVLYGYIWPWCPDSYQTPPRKQPDLEPTFTTIDTCMPWSWGRYQCLRALFVCIKIIFDRIRLQ